MTNYSLPHFEALDPNALEEYYDVDIAYNGRKIQVDLNFERNSIDIKRLDMVKLFIENISAYDRQNRTYIEQDYADEDSDTVRTYIQAHLDIPKEQLKAIADLDNKEIDPEIQMMNALQLVRVGLFPDSVDQFAIFDYSIGRELTQYLVVINTDENGNLDYMAMES